MTALDTYTTRLCQTCQQPVERNPIGRPKLFCSAACRREMAAMREELVELTAQLAAARTKTWGFWPGAAHWTTEVHRLELAIAEHESRFGATP